MSACPEEERLVHLGHEVALLEALATCRCPRASTCCRSGPKITTMEERAPSESAAAALQEEFTCRAQRGQPL